MASGDLVSGFNISPAAVAGAAEGNKESSERNIAKLKAYLSGKGKQEDISNLKQMKDAGLVPEGGQVRSGEVSVGADPSIKLAIMQEGMKQKLTGAAQKEASGLQKTYGAKDKDLQSQADILENGANGVSAGNPIGYKQAAIALARLSEGKSSRIQLPVIEQFAQKSGFKTITDYLNYWGGDTAGNIPDEQVKAIKDALLQHHKRLTNQFQDNTTEFQQQAPFNAPHMKESGMLEPYMATFGSGTKAHLDRVNKIIQDQAAKQQAAPQAQPQGSGLRGFLHGLMSKTPKQAQPQAAPVTTQQLQSGPSAPAGALGGAIDPSHPAAGFLNQR